MQHPKLYIFYSVILQYLIFCDDVKNKAVLIIQNCMVWQ